MTGFGKFITLWSVVAVLLYATACGTVKYVPVHTVEKVTVRDSVYLRDTLIKVEVEKARISDFSGLLDTLYLSTDLARSTAFVDTVTATLRGTLEQSGKLPVQIVWKERTVTKDSLVYRDVPYPVVEEKVVKVVPWFWRVFAVIGIVAVAGAVFRLLRRLKV